MDEQIGEIYGNRLRVRVCGLLVENERLLMVNHQNLATSGFWTPPGGGVNFGETLHDCLRREFREEAGLETEVGEFLFVSEFIKNPLHAIELFFLVRRTGGELSTGNDPEMENDKQIITEVRFLSWQEISAMSPEALHGIFRFTGRPEHITGLRGYFAV